MFVSRLRDTMLLVPSSTIGPEKLVNLELSEVGAGRHGLGFATHPAYRSSSGLNDHSCARRGSADRKYRGSYPLPDGVLLGRLRSAPGTTPAAYLRGLLDARPIDS